MRKYILISCICACILSLIVGWENIDSNKLDENMITNLTAKDIKKLISLDMED